MHFTAPLFALSTAAVALVGASSPANPVPAGHGHLALRQATRAQVVRRNAHNLQRVRRQAAPSTSVNTCGLPESFVIQISGIPTTSTLSQFENQYAAFMANLASGVLSQLLTPEAGMADGQVFKTDNTACALTGYEADVGLDKKTPQGTLFGNTNGGANGLIYFNQYQETAPSNFPLITCRAGAANVLECTSGGNALFTFLCNNQGAPLINFATTATDATMASCALVTLTAFSA